MFDEDNLYRPFLGLLSLGLVLGSFGLTGLGHYRGVFHLTLAVGALCSGLAILIFLLCYLARPRRHLDK